MRAFYNSIDALAVSSFEEGFPNVIPEAMLCGKPKNARQVGYALNRGRLGEGIPAHRIVNARGILSGAAAFAAEDMQRRLLEAEGIEVYWTPDGWQVDLKRYGWKNTMEEALEFREIFEVQGI